jgi:phage-related protein
VWDGKRNKKPPGISRGSAKTYRGRIAAAPIRRNARGCKAVQSVGSGVFEIALRYDRNAFRTVVAVQLGKKLYVLHAFQKKSKRGIETPKQDVDLIVQRYKEAKELAKHET